jgi:hypothetical protein
VCAAAVALFHHYRQQDDDERSDENGTFLVCFGEGQTVPWSAVCLSLWLLPSIIRHRRNNCCCRCDLILQYNNTFHRHPLSFQKMSSWAKKLETKLATLPDNASQESIQTVANWITFNRKHAAVISSTLTERLLQQQQQEQRNNLYWQLIHEIILAERDHPSKWEKLQDLRVALGEGLVTVLEQRSSPSEREVLPFLEEFDVRLKEWDGLNSFGGPSLISQLKRLYQSHKNHGVDGGGASVAAAETSGAVLEESKTAATTIQNDKETATAASPKAEEASTETAKTESSPTPRRSSFSQNNRQVEYDFESKVSDGSNYYCRWCG